MQVQRAVYGCVVVGGSFPDNIWALTKTGMIAPVDREKGRWPKTRFISIRDYTEIFLKGSKAPLLTSQNRRNLTGMACNGDIRVVIHRKNLV